VEQIGEGGCGVVYQAEQEEPVRRRVALKIIKLGMDTRNVIARFEAERQALALMDHPNIAKVFDGGATETGRPYFVMELVRGVRITEYCNRKQLSIRQRLELFAPVCQAIQHAHQKGIIHRDIKPSNILVLDEAVPIPKVIDFGIAKATGQRLTDKTLFTAFERFLGTPAYMSPEQAQMSSTDIDTRSDIYSLGVVLYELLGGTTPFATTVQDPTRLDELRRAIREKDAPRPSTCLNTMPRADLREVARQRRAEPAKLISHLRGDLDWIVMKTLEKERTRRYETANALGEDIQRYLNNEPIVARPPSNIYRFQKLVRRNKLAFASAAAISGAVLLGLGVSIWLFLKEKQARQRAMTAETVQRELRQQAEKSRQEEAALRLQAQADQKKAQTEAAKSEQVAQLLKKMLKGVGPSVAMGRDTTMLREILDKTADNIRHDLTNQPEVAMEMCSTLAATYDDLGLDEQAEEMAREALLFARSAFGEEHAAVAAALRRLGYTLSNRGKLEEAEPLVRQALAQQTKLSGNDSADAADSMRTLANVLWGKGKLAQAEALHREALAIRRKLSVSQDPLLAESLNDLAGVLTIEGKLTEAEAMYRETLRMARDLFGNEHPTLAVTLNNLASVLRRQGKLDEAERLFREALLLEKKIFGNEHPNLAVSLNNLALLLRGQGKLSEAEPMQRQALVIEQKLLGTEHPQTAISLRNLANILGDEGKLEEAEASLRTALATQRKLLGNDNPEVAASIESLAHLLSSEGSLTEAEALSRECLAIREKNSPDEWQTFSTRSLLGASLLAQKRYGEAEPLLLSGYDGLKQRLATIPPANKLRLKEALQRLIEYYQATGQTDPAREWQRKMAEW
jgi:serine/threonine protein kinase